MHQGKLAAHRGERSRLEPAVGGEARRSQLSRRGVSPVDLATPATLAAVFDHFVFDRSLQHDSAMMEAAGAQCLLLAGFFEDQLRRRHNIRWYADLGVGFFSQAAALERSPARVRLLAGIAEGFERWRQRHARLSRELRDQPYLLVPPR